MKRSLKSSWNVPSNWGFLASFMLVIIGSIVLEFFTQDMTIVYIYAISACILTFLLPQLPGLLKKGKKWFQKNQPKRENRTSLEKLHQIEEIAKYFRRSTIILLFIPMYVLLLTSHIAYTPIFLTIIMLFLFSNYLNIDQLSLNKSKVRLFDNMPKFRLSTKSIELVKSAILLLDNRKIDNLPVIKSSIHRNNIKEALLQDEYDLLWMKLQTYGIKKYLFYSILYGLGYLVYFVLVIISSILSLLFIPKLLILSLKELIKSLLYFELFTALFAGCMTLFCVKNLLLTSQDITSFVISISAAFFAGISSKELSILAKNKKFTVGISFMETKKYLERVNHWMSRNYWIQIQEMN